MTVFSPGPKDQEKIKETERESPSQTLGHVSSSKVILDVCFPRRPQSMRILNGIPSGIAVC